MPAARSFKAKKGAEGEIGFCLRLFAFGGKPYSMFGQNMLHFPKVGFAVVAEVFADVFGRCSQQHCKNSLTALQVGGFVNIINVHLFFLFGYIVLAFNIK